MLDQKVIGEPFPVKHKYLRQPGEGQVMKDTQLLPFIRSDILDAAEEIHFKPQPEGDELAFSARELVTATLPHRSPRGNPQEWSRQDGNYTLSIRGFGGAAVSRRSVQGRLEATVWPSRARLQRLRLIRLSRSRCISYLRAETGCSRENLPACR